MLEVKYMSLQSKGRLTVNTIRGRADVSKEIHNSGMLNDLFQGYQDIDEEEILIEQYHLGYFGRLARKKKVDHKRRIKFTDAPLV